MNNNKVNKYMNGFTLIELLAVILILGIIALIAIPTITSIIADVEKSSIMVSMQNLIDAGEKYYMRLQYADTSCIDVNTPDLDFDNKLGSISGSICYDDDKDEAYLKDVIFEDYIFNGTTDNLVLTEIDRSITPVYTLENRVFDGVDDYVDTGYALFDEYKDFTLIVSVTAAADYSSVAPPTIFHCMREVTPYPGIAFDQMHPKGRIVSLGGEYTDIFSQTMYENKHILVLKLAKGSSSLNTYIFDSDGSIVTKNKTVSTITTFDQNLYIGAYRDSSNVMGRFFKGTVHYFALYMDALDDETIKSIMTELK